MDIDHSILVSNSRLNITQVFSDHNDSLLTVCNLMKYISKNQCQKLYQIVKTQMEDIFYHCSLNLPLSSILSDLIAPSYLNIAT